MIHDTDPDIIGAGHNPGALGESGELYLATADNYTKLLNDPDTWLQLTGLNEGVATKNVIIDGIAGTISLVTPGVYTLGLFVTHSVSKNDTYPDLTMAIFANGVQIPQATFDASTEQGVSFLDTSGIETAYRITEPTELVVKIKFGISGTVAIPHLNFIATGVYS
jgi:hypothetical protein